jgi:hypothetical protein
MAFGTLLRPKGWVVLQFPVKKREESKKIWEKAEMENVIFPEPGWQSRD